jgi:hypothetical protein
MPQGQDNTLIILGICGFLTVCFGLLVLAFITIFRFGGRNFLGFLGILSRGAKEADAETSGRFVPSRRDLHNVAQEHDFEAALAKHIVTDELAPTHPPAQSAQSVNPYTPSAPTSSQPAAQPATRFSPEGSRPSFTRGDTPPPAAPINPTNAPPHPQFGAQSRPAAITPPSSQPPTEPPTPTTPDDLGWEDPSLKRRKDQRDLRRRDQDDDDDLIGGLIDDGNVFG